MKSYSILCLFIFILAACSLPGVNPGVTPTFPATALPAIGATPTLPSVAIPTTVSAPNGLVIEMYALNGPPATDPLTFSPSSGTQDQIIVKNQKMRDQDPNLRLDQANQALQPFGYRIETTPPGEITTTNLYTVTKVGAPVIRQSVFGFLPVSVKADGSDFMMVLDASNGNYLVNAKGATLGGLGVGTGAPPPVFLDNQVLAASEIYTDTAGSGGHVSVAVEGRDIFTTSIGLPSPVNALRGVWADGKGWTLEIARASGDTNTFEMIGEIYQNGISLNRKFGYQASFEYQVFGGKPFFFYQKNDQIGISYDGQEIPLGIDEIPHYGCCSGAELNPREYLTLIDFFARKGQAWYFVEISKE